MYSTCLFCQGELGKNQEIEHFPIGRRLAFDGAKGRLWVVCRKCERWNLTPLEERWEAIEECERIFRETRTRVSTDHIGLARLKEGLELVRIGDPQRPEMAAWRYGDQFGRRRRKQYATVAGVAVVVGTVAIAGPLMGLVGFGALSPALNLMNMGRHLYTTQKKIPVPDDKGVLRGVSLVQLPKVKLFVDGDGILLRIPATPGRSMMPWWRYDQRIPFDIDIRGEAAIRAAGALLPRMNLSGGSKDQVSRAVRHLEDARSPAHLFRTAVNAIEKREREHFFLRNQAHLLKNLPISGRLALEMAAHEDSERRALEGELHVLEEAWKAAEEIAGIADDMFLPASVDEDLARLKREREGQ